MNANKRFELAERVVDTTITAMKRVIADAGYKPPRALSKPLRQMHTDAVALHFYNHPPKRSKRTK